MMKVKALFEGAPMANLSESHPIFDIVIMVVRMTIRQGLDAWSIKINPPHL